MIYQCCQHSHSLLGLTCRILLPILAEKGVISVGRREGLDNITTSTTLSLIPTYISWNVVDFSALTHPSQSPG